MRPNVETDFWSNIQPSAAPRFLTAGGYNPPDTCFQHWVTYICLRPRIYYAERLKAYECFRGESLGTV